MIKKLSLLKYEIYSTIFIMVLGTLLHFSYKWSNNNIFVACFSAVNESTWEHLKLIFFPSLITTILGFHLFKHNYPNYYRLKLKSLLLSLSFIVIFFYTYTGILGTNSAFINISSFFIAILLGELSFLKKINKSNNNQSSIIYPISFLFLTLISILYTFYPPHIGLFKDPITETYGIFKK